MEMNDDTIEINNITVKYEEFKEFINSMMRNKLLRTWRIMGMVFLIFLVLMVVTLLIFMSSMPAARVSRINTANLNSISPWIKLALLIFVLVIVPWFIYPKVYDKLLKKSFYNNKLLQKPQTYKFKNSGFEVFSEHGENRFKWTELYCIKDLKLCFVLCINKYQGFIIPKRYLINRSDITKLIKNMETN